MEIGVPNKYRARQFICRLWVTDKKGNKHLATCLCDNGSEVNLQSERFLPDKCVDTSLHPVNLEGVSGHALPGGNTGSFLKACNGSSDSTQLYTDVIRITMILRCTLVQ